MRSSEAPPYSISSLLELRFGVIAAYVRNTDRKFMLEDMLVSPPSNHNGYYKRIAKNIKSSIQKEISESSLYKLLYTLPRRLREGILTESDRKFETAKIELLEEYCNTIKTPSGTTYLRIDRTKLRGADIIDYKFVATLNGVELVEQHKDFFMGKTHNSLQWHGVIRSWDCRREHSTKVKDHVIDNFNQPVAVIAVVHGVGGCGKSLFLRKLAIDLLNDDLTVLWVTDLSDFCNFTLKEIAEGPEKYLVLLEDWYAIRDDGLALILLQRVSQLSNMRLVIGDRNPIEEKIYHKYTLGKSKFELSAKENKEIATKALKITKDWRDSGYEITSSEIYNAPIYLILFVIAREIEKETYKDTRPYLNRFQDIVENDYVTIEEFYPGLAPTMYYWANLHKEYGVYISWNALQKLAWHYKSYPSARRSLSNIDANNPVVNILSHYISFKKFVNPDLAGFEYFIFHHDVLIEDGLKTVMLRGWKSYDRMVGYEFADALWEEGEYDSAVDLIEYLHDEDLGKATVLDDGLFNVETGFKHPEILETLQSGEKFNYAGFYVWLFIDRFIETYYENADKNKSEQYWTNSMYYFLFQLDCFSYASRLVIMRRVIDLGCTSEVVHKVYSWLLNNKLDELSSFFKTVKISPYRFRKDKNGRLFFGWINTDRDK